MSHEWLCENIEGYEFEEEEFEEEEFETTNWDLQLIEAREFENSLVKSGYYNRMRWING